MESRDVVFQFLQEQLEDKINLPIDEFNGKTIAYLYHTSHEFHHKGQVMTMARVLGHIPPDTDVMRF